MTGLGHLTGEGQGTVRPGWSVAKFDEAGRPRHTPGLTTLCHLDPASAAFAAVREAQVQMRAGSHAGAFAFLPPESFHMTVFDGVIDYHRGPGQWPEAIDPERPIAEVEALWRTRFGTLRLPERFVLRATGIDGGFTIGLEGRDAVEEATLRAARDALSECFGLRRPAHDSYRFHITLSYLLRWIAPEAAEEVTHLSHKAFARARHALDRIELGPVELCRFETMLRFETLDRARRGQRASQEDTEQG